MIWPSHCNGTRDYIGLTLWVATEQRTHLKPTADELFRWLSVASESTFLRSLTSEVPSVPTLGDLDWPALLAAVLESSLLSSCPPPVATMFGPQSRWLPASAAPRTYRRTTRGNGRYIQKQTPWQSRDIAAAHLLALPCCGAECLVCLDM